MDLIARRTRLQRDNADRLTGSSASEAAFIPNQPLIGFDELPLAKYLINFNSNLSHC
ncbi:MAG: hypothetical protein ACXWFI_11915 [Methylobacter sp.]